MVFENINVQPEFFCASTDTCEKERSLKCNVFGEKMLYISAEDINYLFEFQYIYCLTLPSLGKDYEKQVEL